MLLGVRMLLYCQLWSLATIHSRKWFYKPLVDDKWNRIMDCFVSI